MTFYAHVPIKIGVCFAKWLQLPESMQKVAWYQGNTFLALKYLWRNHTIVRKFFLDNGLRMDKEQRHIWQCTTASEGLRMSNILT